MANGKIKTSVYLTSEVKEWVDKRAEKIGITTSAMISVALTEYMKQDETVKALPKFTEWLNMIKDQKLAPQGQAPQIGKTKVDSKSARITGQFDR